MQNGVREVLSGDKWKNIVTVDGAWVYLNDCSNYNKYISIDIIMKKKKSLKQGSTYLQEA